MTNSNEKCLMDLDSIVKMDLEYVVDQLASSGGRLLDFITVQSRTGLLD